MKCNAKTKIMDPKNCETNLGGVSEDAESGILPLISIDINVKQQLMKVF